MVDAEMGRAVTTDTIIQRFSGSYHPEIHICERGDVRFMRFGHRGGWQGAVKGNDWGTPVFAYQRAFLALLRAIETPRRFLSLGVGTGTSLRHVRGEFPTTELYGVEIDQTVVDAAIAYFDSPSHKDANYWIGDGIAFLCNVDLQFDLIFVDAYLKDKIYNPCLDPAFATVLDAATLSGGTVVCNLISRFPRLGKVGAFLAAARERFAHVLVLPVGLPILGIEQNTLAVFTQDAQLASKWQQNIQESQELSWLERRHWPLRLRTFRGTPVL